MTTNENNWIEDVGQPAYASIARMVAALECDFDRLTELRDDQELGELDDDDAQELEDLQEEARGCDDRDEAIEAIYENPLSLRIFGEYENGKWYADNYELLLTTGGPAVRIIGDIDQYGEATSARLQVQDWGKPWTEYVTPGDAQNVILAYAQCFNYETK